jgi:hypothetical protein
VVRAPAAAVPFLSLGFWVVTWWWLPPGLGRHRFLLGMLAAFGLLTALRLPRLPTLPRPSPATVLVLLVALARLSPIALRPTAPGPAASERAVSALLMSWHDSVPRSAAPLSLEPFRADSAGLDGLAADLTLLAGLPAHRAAFLAAAAAQGLLQLACFALLCRFVSPEAAALATISGLALLGWTDPPATLALAFFLAAVALLVGARSRSRAVAGGLLLAGSLPSATGLCALPWLLLPPAFEAALRRRVPERSLVLERLALAAGTALSLDLPFLVRGQFGLAPGTRALPTLLAVAAALCAAPLAQALLGRIGAASRAGRALLAAFALVGLLAAGRVAGDREAPSAEALAALDWLRAHTRPLDVVCAEGWVAGEWVPAIAQRASQASTGRPCSVLVGDVAPGEEPILFHNAAAVVRVAPPR